MKRLVPILIATLMPNVVGCDSPGGNAEVQVTDAVIHLPAVPGRPSAGYFQMSAPENRVALTGVSSSQASRIEMHETVSANGMNSMRRVTRQEIRHQDIAFVPGARHLMIFNLDPALRVGERVPLTFSFAEGEPVTIEAEVLGPGGTNADH